MSFLWPQYLWLLLLAPILVAAYFALLRRKKVAVRFADLSIVRQAIRPGQALRLMFQRDAAGKVTALRLQQVDDEIDGLREAPVKPAP